MQALLVLSPIAGRFANIITREERGVSGVVATGFPGLLAKVAFLQWADFPQCEPFSEKLHQKGVDAPVVGTPLPKINMYAGVYKCCDLYALRFISLKNKTSSNAI